MKKIKDILLSEKGMGIVNILFFLSVVIRNSGISSIACLVWIAYLALGIKNTQSKAVKIINSVFLVFAAAMIIANVCLFLNII